MNKLGFNVLISLLFLNACSSSVNSEQKRWERNLQQISNLKTKYPAFASLLAVKLEEAQKIADEAKGISDEKQKIEKIAQANQILEVQFVQDLVAIEYKIGNVQKEMDNLAKKKFSKSSLNKVREGIQKASGLLMEVKNHLRQGGSENQVAEFLRKDTGELISMAGKMRTLAKSK